MNRVMRASISMCSSFQIPRSWGLMRASGNTAVASVKTREAPPTARLPRCTRCQSVAKPSVLEYWHIGETIIRLGSRTSRICRLSKSIGWLPEIHCHGSRGEASIARGFSGVKLNVFTLAQQQSVVATMNFHMAMIGRRFEQPQHVLAGRSVETVNQYSVRSAIVGSKLKLGIVDHDVPIVLDSKLGSDLQRNFGFIRTRSHADLLAFLGPLR